MDGGDFVDPDEVSVVMAPVASKPIVNSPFPSLRGAVGSACLAKPVHVGPTASALDSTRIYFKHGHNSACLFSRVVVVVVVVVVAAAAAAAAVVGGVSYVQHFYCRRGCPKLPRQLPSIDAKYNTTAMCYRHL